MFYVSLSCKHGIADIGLIFQVSFTYSYDFTLNLSIFVWILVDAKVLDGQNEKLKCFTEHKQCKALSLCNIKPCH